MIKPTPRQPWLLYHGTSTLRLHQIRNDNVLRMSSTGDPKVALTPDRSVAEYFSFVALAGDRHDRPGEITRPVILVLDGEVLVGQRYVMEAYSDDTFGEGECDWENELACEDDIDPLHEILIRVETVPLDRFDMWQRDEDRLLFRPSRPWILERLLARNEEGFRRLCDEVLEAAEE